MKKTLENQVMNRRTALVGLAAGVLASYGCTKQKDPAQIQIEKDIEDYNKMVENHVSYRDFKEALGNRYLPEKEADLREFWNDCNVNEKFELNGEVLTFNSRDEFYTMYAHIENSQIYRNITRHEKQAYQEFAPTQEDFKRVKSLPWKINEDYNESDKLFLYLGEKFKSLENPLQDWNFAF